MNRASDTPSPAPAWMTIALVALYALLLIDSFWLTGVDIAIAHAWHWLGGKLA